MKLSTFKWLAPLCLLLASAGALFAQGYGYFPPIGITWTQANGMALGSATNGAQGAGTLNAQNLYINGVAVSAAQQPANVPAYKVQPTDATNSTGSGTPNNTNALAFGAQVFNAAGVYRMRCWILYNTANATTFLYTPFTSGTTTGIGHVSDSINIVGGATFGSSQAQTTNSFQTAAIQTVAGTIWLEEVINYTTGAGNSMQFNFASGTGGNTVTMKAGSWCKVEKIG